MSRPIKIAILPHVFVEPDETAAQKAKRAVRGMVWILEPGEHPERMPIESGTPHSIRLEIQTLLERYAGQTIEVAIYQFLESDVPACVAIVDLVHAVQVVRAGGSLQHFKPFTGRVAFRGATTINYRPHWVEKPEPVDVMRGMDLDDYFGGGGSKHKSSGGRSDPNTGAIVTN